MGRLRRLHAPGLRHPHPCRQRHPAHSGDKSLRVFYPEGRSAPRTRGHRAVRRPQVPRVLPVVLGEVQRRLQLGHQRVRGQGGRRPRGRQSLLRGQPCDGTNGFTSRPIWSHDNGTAAVYYYSMAHEGEYGDDVVLQKDGADITWPKGEWVNVVQRLKVNTVTDGTANPTARSRSSTTGSPPPRRPDCASSATTTRSTRRTSPASPEGHHRLRPGERQLHLVRRHQGVHRPERHLRAERLFLTHPPTVPGGRRSLPAHRLAPHRTARESLHAHHAVPRPRSLTTTPAARPPTPR
ncbi:hypothetical protein NKH77_06460 [Streptomyces sp. M19]